MAEFKPPDKEGVISMENSLAHTKWMCKYHIVFTPKYSKEDHLQQVQGKHCTDTERSMQMEKGGDHRGESDGGSYSPTGVDTAKV